MKILLSLASKQNWPQLLVMAHLCPERVLLLHSQDEKESKGPAQRLKRLLDKPDLIPKGGTTLEPVPHDDFNAINGDALPRFDRKQHASNVTEVVNTERQGWARSGWYASAGSRGFWLGQDGYAPVG